MQIRCKTGNKLIWRSCNLVRLQRWLSCRFGWHGPRPGDGRYGRLFCSEFVVVPLLGNVPAVSSARRPSRTFAATSADAPASDWTSWMYRQSLRRTSARPGPGWWKRTRTLHAHASIHYSHGCWKKIPKSREIRRFHFPVPERSWIFIHLVKIPWKKSRKLTGDVLKTVSTDHCCCMCTLKSFF